MNRLPVGFAAAATYIVAAPHLVQRAKISGTAKLACFISIPISCKGCSKLYTKQILQKLQATCLCLLNICTMAAIFHCKLLSAGFGMAALISPIRRK